MPTNKKRRTIAENMTHDISDVKERVFDAISSSLQETGKDTTE